MICQFDDLPICWWDDGEDCKIRKVLLFWLLIW